MHYYEVAPSVIIRAQSASFTYASDVPLAVGQIVTIPVGKKLLIGVVIREVTQPSYETKPVASIINDAVLPKHLVATAQWMSEYYATHLALAFQTILPKGITKTRRQRKSLPRERIRKRTNIVFNELQSKAIKTLSSMSPGTGILHGVTGSGKTAVYIELARRTIADGKSVIVLTPEISLTPQLVDEFTDHFADVTVTHSRQTEAERHMAWSIIHNRDTPQVVIGPRSALFMPVKNIGLIIIDESHEPSYKQEQSPRYSALRVASIIAKECSARVIQGSATPSISEYYLARHSDRPIVNMPERAAANVVAADISLVDMTDKSQFSSGPVFSKSLLASIQETLANDQQVLLFHNRRGSANLALCTNCGWSATCARCFVPYTLHADRHELRCHICNARERVPTHCPECKETDIAFKGIGTKLIESELQRLYPDKTIARFDGDSDNTSTVEARYNELYTGAIDIIVGTQVIAKGLDLPHLRLVGIPQADAGLSLPDYSSSERTFQLLYQAIGRVGRSHHPTRVIVQSFQPHHPAIQHGIAQDYSSFYNSTLLERQHAHFPPYAYLLKLTCIYKTEAVAVRNAAKLATIIRATYPTTVKVLGPSPAFYERQRDTYRWQIVIRSASRAHLLDIISLIPPTHWQYELDPIGLI